MKNQSETTTIKLRKQTKARIDKLKVYRRETYDELLERLLNLLNLARVNPERAQTRLRVIERRTRRKNVGQRLIGEEDVSAVKRVRVN